MSGTDQTKDKTYQAALYMRLSKDDGAGESASISTQRSMLKAYAREHGYAVYREYADDGFSGTTYDRPAFQDLLADIEAGRVNLVITRDLSRLGRDYILTGQYTELYFPSKGVRYIAVNDGYDSINPGNDLAPFQNIVNEMYARDTSKKIRSALKTKMKEGAFIGNFAPYGYQKDPQDKNRLLIDPFASLIVKEIFDRILNGEAPSRIAKQLNQKKIKTPAQYLRLHLQKPEPVDMENQIGWTSKTICKILANPVYAGDMVQGKTSKLSFKSKITLKTPKKDWIVVKNKHEPIVSKEVFERVGRRSISRKYLKEDGFINVFSGIAYCGDCKRVMSFTGSTNKKLVCSGYKQYGKAVCTNHYMDYELLNQLVSSELNALLRITNEEKDELAGALEALIRKGEDPEKKKASETRRKREREIDCIMKKLYEDRTKDILSEERFRKLLHSYEEECKEIQAEVDRLKQSMFLPGKNRETIKAEVDQWFYQLKENQMLTSELLHQFVDRIEIFQEEDLNHNEKTIQRIRITYRMTPPDSGEA